MLININPVLSPELLFHLRSMGHGEKLILADANFPANTSNDKVKFFNKGPKNIWHNTLPENIRLELEDKLKNEMIELGYLETN